MLEAERLVRMPCAKAVCRDFAGCLIADGFPLHPPRPVSAVDVKRCMAPFADARCSAKRIDQACGKIDFTLFGLHFLRMAGHLPKAPESFHRMDGVKVAIISSMWHQNCIDGMIVRATSEFQRLGCRDVETYSLPGSYELPLAARLLFETKPDLDLIVAFGVVLKGGTTHDGTVLQEVVSGFSRVMHEVGKPIINEVIGVNAIEDAQKRSGNDDWNKGLEAVFAASEFMKFRSSLLR